MALDERGWHRLYDRTREVLGEEEADTLMARLPVTGWTDLVTKKDLEVLEHKLTAVFERGLRSQMRTFILGNAALIIALAGYFSAVR